MSAESRKLIIALGLYLFLGGIIGWIYGRPETGLLVATVSALVWQLRQTLTFDNALRDNDFSRLGYGEGIWSQFASRVSYLRDQSKAHRKNYRRLLKEVRKSTNAMPDGGIVLNSDDQIIHCNRMAQKLVGLRRKRDRGQRVDNILRDPLFIKYLQSGSFENSIEFPSPIDGQSWLWCRIVPYGADQKLLLLRDVTANKKLTRMRREFVANASHELRSPLTVISGYLDSIADDPGIDGAWEGPLEQMQIQTQRMKQVVAELLELSRLEGAGAASRDVLVDIAGLLASAKNIVAARAAIPTIVLDVQTRAMIRGNSSELESVVWNLLTNAIRHTPSNGTVKLSWTADSEGGRLTVSDNGEGIADEHLPRITERFYRVDEGRAREDGGVGLGLAIVKYVLQRHEAELSIQSELGVGSCFICKVPGDRIEADPEASMMLDHDSASAQT